MPDFYTTLTQNRCQPTDIAGREFYQTLAQDGKVSTDNDGVGFYATLTRNDDCINPLN
jgi:hypothetical protein